MDARVANVVLGAWLFLSAFLWPHGGPQFHNAWISGTIIVTVAMAGLGGAQRARLVNSAVGGWLLVSSLLLGPITTGTFWNHVAVGVAVGVFGLGTSLASIARREPVNP